MQHKTNKTQICIIQCATTKLCTGMGEINDRPTCRSLGRPPRPPDVNVDVRSDEEPDGGDEINDRFCSMAASHGRSRSTLKSGDWGAAWKVTRVGDHLFRPYLYRHADSHAESHAISLAKQAVPSAERPFLVKRTRGSSRRSSYPQTQSSRRFILQGRDRNSFEVAHRQVFGLGASPWQFF